MRMMQILVAALFWLGALPPLCLGGLLAVVLIKQVFRTSTSSILTSLHFPAIGFIPEFTISGGEIVPFTLGCLTVAAGLIAAGCFIAFKRGDGDAPAQD
ncbi:MAG: hypothetical protein EBS05_23585 [Proteobacteria bacterium]|nr:hypothetical protein [Pseudomonadota bacterium]